MNQLPPVYSPRLPTIIANASSNARTRYLEFLAANIRNAHTHRAYAQATREFLDWCERTGVASVADVKPLHVAASIEQLTKTHSAPTVKQGLAAIRHLFDWLLTGHVIEQDPAHSVHGPSHRVKRGKTPVLEASEARALIESIDVTTTVGLRDRALIGVYSFARVGAALSMKVEDVYVQNRRLWVRLHGKGGKRHEMPCHRNLETYLHAYIDGCGLGRDPKGPLFRTIGRGTAVLTETPLPQAPSQRLSDDPSLRGSGGDRDEDRQSHLRATGITAYLKNGGTLEKAAAMANHASTRTTSSTTGDEVGLDEMERVVI